MAEFERTTTVGMGADAAFEILADPRRLPEYAPTVRHVDTTVVDGEPDDDAPGEGPGETAQARFLADREARRVEWALPNTDYEGSVVVAAGTTSTSQVTIRVRTGDDGGDGELERMLDEMLRNLRRLLARR
jgi:hypothetical protein